MKFKKVLSLAAVALMTTSLLAGCGNSSSQKSGEELQL